MVLFNGTLNANTMKHVPSIQPIICAFALHALLRLDLLGQIIFATSLTSFPQLAPRSLSPSMDDT